MRKFFVDIFIFRVETDCASFTGKSKQENNKIRAFLFVIINIIISDIIALMCFLLLGFNDVPLEQAANKKPGALANSNNLHYIITLYFVKAEEFALKKSYLDDGCGGKTCEQECS